MERKRFLAVVMTVMMVISMIPSMVFAAAPSGELGGKLKIKGLAAVGVVVSADYAKVTPEEVTDEDFTFSWSRQTGEKELTQEVLRRPIRSLRMIWDADWCLI